MYSLTVRSGLVAIGIALIFLLLIPLHAQQLPLRTFTPADGLLRSEVLALCQDLQGFIWLGTMDGLCRYDGTRFVRIPIPGGSGAVFINALLPDSTGGVWVATNGGGIARCDSGTVSLFIPRPHDPHAPENRVNTLCLLGRDGLLAGTDRGLFLLSGGAFTALGPEGASRALEVTALTVDRRRRIWLGTGQGLFLLPDAQRAEWSAIPAIRGLRVTALAEDTAGVLWVGTEKGLRSMAADERLDATGHPAVPGELAHPVIRSLLPDSRGTLWVSTEEDGLFRFTADRLVRYTAANGLPSSRVLRLMEDRERDIWIATAAGLSKLSRQNILNYLLPGRLARSPVTTMAADRAGGLWFGTPYGVSRLSGGRFRTLSERDGLSSDYALAILADSRGNVWVGTTRGLSRYALAADGTTLRSRPTPNSLRGHTIRCLHEDPSGTLWIGWERGLAALRNDRTALFVFPDSLQSPMPIALAHDRAGLLWVGTQGDGLFSFSLQEGRTGVLTIVPGLHYDEKNGLDDPSVRTLLAEPDGSLWIGSRSSGAVRVLPGDDSLRVLVRYSTASGLSGDWVRSIMRDRSGTLWIATGRGVDRLMQDGPLGPVFTTLRQDLAGDDANMILEDPSGVIWIGATHGVTRYVDLPEARRVDPPPVYITRVQVVGTDDSTALRAGYADLSYDQHSLAFEYAGLSFSDGGGVRYRYMLEGLDTDWGSITDRRYVNYTHLPPGHFRFRVMARSGDGSWGTPASFRFDIAAPLWAQSWFIACAILLVMSAAFLLHLLRVRRLLEMERVRTRIAADLHDDIGSTLSSISIFSRLAEQELGAASPDAARLLHRIGVNAQAIMESLDDIVWMVKPGNDSLEQMVVRLREYAASVLEAKGICLTVSTPADVSGVRMSLESRRHFYLVAKEAVTNIVKHARCTRTDIVLALHGRELVLSVKDDGQGFDLEARRLAAGRRGRSGMMNMQRRADAAGAYLSIDSAPGRGTEIVLRTRIT